MNDSVTLSIPEYKQYLLDTCIKEEKERFIEARHRYEKALEEVTDEVEAHTRARIQNAKDPLEDLIQEYESNWFVRFFLKKKAHDKVNNKNNWW